MHRTIDPVHVSCRASIEEGFGTVMTAAIVVVSVRAASAVTVSGQTSIPGNADAQAIFRASLPHHMIVLVLW